MTSITVNSRKFDQTIRRSWQCELVSTNDEIIVLQGVFDAEVQHPDLGSIERGTVSLEYFWTDRWYNIFRFSEPDGALRNYYCNVAMPPTFDGKVLDYVDLDIDIVVWPDKSYQVVDESEFEANADRWNYPTSVREEAGRSLNYLLTLVERSEFPFK